MKKMIRTINHYFFPGENEDIHWSDYVWFYGTLGFMGIMLIFALIVSIINSWG